MMVLAPWTSFITYIFQWKSNCKSYLSSLEASIVLWNKNGSIDRTLISVDFNEVILIYYYLTKKSRLQWKFNLIFPEHQVPIISGEVLLVITLWILACIKEKLYDIKQYNWYRCCWEKLVIKLNNFPQGINFQNKKISTYEEISDNYLIGKRENWYLKKESFTCRPI